MNQQPASIEGNLDSGSNEPPVRIRPWPTYDKGDVTTDQADANAAFSAVTSRRLFRYDTRPLRETETGQFEAEVAKYFGVDYALATTSGTSAIALCLLGLGIGHGDEVLVSCFGFPATPSAIVLTGATPVLVSVNEELHMDLQDAQRKITPRTKAILMVHMRGQTGDVRAAATLCERNGIHLVEDAVPVLGLKVGYKLAGTFGAASAFSTQSDKSLNTGEGGFLITNDPLIYQRAVVMCGAYEGRIKKHILNDEPIIDEFSYPLFNFRMDEIRAAIARVQLSRLSSRVKQMKRNYELASTIVAAHPQLRLRQPFDVDATLGDTILFSMPSGSPEQLSALSAMLNREGIECRSFSNVDRLNVRAFWTWRFLFPGMSEDEIRATMPEAARNIGIMLDIPLSPLLDLPDFDDMARAFAKVMPHF